VVSDWLAQHTGVASAMSGLDMVMPDSALWANLSMAVANGTMPQVRKKAPTSYFLSVLSTNIFY